MKSFFSIFFIIIRNFDVSRSSQDQNEVILKVMEVIHEVNTLAMNLTISHVSGLYQNWKLLVDDLV